MLAVMPRGFLESTSDTPPEDALLVRPSSYSSYALCGYRLLLQDHPDYDPGSNEAPGFGTGMHALIEHFLLTGEIPDADGVLTIWERVMADRGEDLRSYAALPYLMELAVELKFGLMAWFNTFWLPVGSQLELLAVEERVMRGLGILPSGREVWVSGAPDLVTPGQIIDFKTAVNGWKEGKSQSNMVQINTYAWLAEHHTDVTVGIHQVYNRSKRTWSWDDTTLPISTDSKHLALLAMWDMARSLDQGIAVATPHSRGGFGDGRGWHCTPKFCGAWNACPFKGMIPDGRADEVRPPIRWDTEAGS